MDDDVARRRRARRRAGRRGCCPRTRLEVAVAFERRDVRGVAGREVVEGDDARRRARRALREVAADEPGAAGHEIPHVAKDRGPDRHRVVRSHGTSTGTRAVVEGVRRASAHAARTRPAPRRPGRARRGAARAVRRRAAPSRMDWADVVAKYADVVYTMAYRLTGDDEEARDLAQDVLIRLHKGLAKYREGNFEGWLYRTTVNAFRDRLRKRKRLREDVLPDEPPGMKTTGIVEEEVAARRAARGRPARAREAAGRVPRGRRAPRSRGTFVRGDRRDPRHPGRDRPFADPPRTRSAAPAAASRTSSDEPTRRALVSGFYMSRHVEREILSALIDGELDRGRTADGARAPAVVCRAAARSSRSSRRSTGWSASCPRLVAPASFVSDVVERPRRRPMRAQVATVAFGGRRRWVALGARRGRDRDQPRRTRDSHRRGRDAGQRVHRAPREHPRRRRAGRAGALRRQRALT